MLTGISDQMGQQQMQQIRVGQHRPPGSRDIDAPVNGGADLRGKDRIKAAAQIDGPDVRRGRSRTHLCQEIGCDGVHLTDGASHIIHVFQRFVRKFSGKT